MNTKEKAPKKRQPVPGMNMHLWKNGAELEDLWIFGMSYERLAAHFSVSVEEIHFFVEKVL
jgi:hypothetical protein